MPEQYYQYGGEQAYSEEDELRRLAEEAEDDTGYYQYEGDEAYAQQQQQQQQPPQPVQQAPVTMPNAVPPPPPPPPPSGMDELSSSMTGFSQDWLDNPNRYLSDLAQSTRAASEDRIGRMREDSIRGMDEYYASRGLPGSSFEEGSRYGLEGQLASAAMEDERQLLEMIANAESVDRMGAGQLGLDTIGRLDELGLDRYRAGLEGLELGESQRFSQQDIDLRAMQIQNQAEQFGKSMSFEEAQAEANRQLERERLEQQGSQFQQELAQQESQFGRTFGIAQREVDLRAQEIVQRYGLENRSLDIQEAMGLAEVELARERLGISQQDVDLRAQQLVQEAALENRQLDIQEAYNQAQVELATREMAVQMEQFGMSMGQRESEFARSHQLDESKFLAEMDQFAKQYGEQVAGRLQADEHFKLALADQKAQSAVDAGLRERALELQEQGMTMDDAYRAAALAQEKELTESAQRLQQYGIDTEDAYRYAALEQDSAFRTESLRLQEMGLSLEDAYRYAELAHQEDVLAQRQEEFREEMEFRISQAETDKEQFDLMMELWEKYFGEMDPEDPPPPPGGTGTNTNTGFSGDHDERQD